MVQLTSDYLKEKLKIIQGTDSQTLKVEEYEKWLVFNGKIKEIVESAILREFKEPTVVQELINRIIPINIMKKIVEKLAAVYVESPIRDVGDGNEGDMELLEQYEDTLNINVKMKLANKYFKLFKKLLVEIYLDENKLPAMRVLPPHTYFAFSSSSVSPEIPDCIFKVLNYDTEASKQKFVVWTASQFLVISGDARILTDEMAALNNEGVNPYGTLPFVYMVESQVSTEPIPDDDLMRATIALPIMISDCALGIKYQSWGLIVTKNCSGNIPAGPTAVVHLQSQPGQPEPSIDKLQPTLNVESTLAFIESFLAYLLSSRGLKTDSLSGKLNQGDPASGISKAIDNAEVAEDKKEQQAYFFRFETEFWHKLSRFMIPQWRKSGQISPAINQEFSSTFEPFIQLREPKVTMTAAEQIELSNKRIEYGFSTHKRELYALYPDMDESEIEMLLKEIVEEKLVKDAALSQEMNPEELPAGGNPNGVENGV